MELISKESIKWHEAWKFWRDKGVDGFKVGFPQGKSIGPLTFDYFCPYCNLLIAENRNRLEKRDIQNYVSHYFFNHDLNFINELTNGINGEGI